MAEDRDEAIDPFDAALDRATIDEEPFTDADRAASEAGWREHQRGESTSLEDLRHARRLISIEAESNPLADV